MNVTSAVRQAVERTSWFKKRQRYRVLYWREISPLAVPILLENACVLLMGVLSTFLVSWLGKEAMAGVGLADSFNMVIMSFFAAIDLGTTVVVAFSLGKRDRRRARAARAPVAGHYDAVFHFAGGGDPCLWPGDY
ncbi:MATE family multidrug exporter [Klebsiella pneumoniae subsp. rhinoscleromatis]|nr:MATE family multidrug exporter [Klebsiella pneumoniae subsp. rhinoscleromatis]